jgi:hypothetical protein
VTAAVEEGLAQRRVLSLLPGPARPAVTAAGGATPDRAHQRPVVPRGLVPHPPGPRWFRWDRIEAAELTIETVADRDPALFGAPPPDAHPVH